MLDAPLDIPVLSRLYKKISGDTLSFLDLICLVGAIPATIIYKLSTGEVPYPDNSRTKALINATDFSTLSSLIVGGQRQVYFANSAIAAKPPSPTPLTICNAVFNIFACFGSFAVVYFSAEKWALNTAAIPVPIPRPLKIFSIVSYVVIVMPGVVSTDPKYWGNIMNDVITVIAIGKTFADTFLQNKVWEEFSPIAESFINFVWCVPVIAGYAESEKKGGDLLALIAGMLFNVGGILAPGTVVKWFEEAAPEIFGATQLLTLGYGVGSLGVALSDFNV